MTVVQPELPFNMQWQILGEGDATAKDCGFRTLSTEETQASEATRRTIFLWFEDGTPLRSVGLGFQLASRC